MFVVLKPDGDDTERCCSSLTVICVLSPTRAAISSIFSSLPVTWISTNGWGSCVLVIANHDDTPFSGLALSA